MNTDIRNMNVAELQSEEARIKACLADAEDIASDLRVRMQDVKQELQRRLRPAPEPRVSDHALFRYMQRVYGIDVEAIRAEIMTDNAKAALKMGATGYTVNGVKFKAKDGVLVTVIA